MIHVDDSSPHTFTHMAVEMARDQQKRRLSAMSGRSSMQADMAIHMEDDVPLQYEGISHSVALHWQMCNYV